MVTGYGPPDTPDQVPPGQAHVLALVYTTVLCNRITSEIALLSQLLESAGGDKEPGSERATPPPPPADAGVEAGSRSVGVRAVKPVRKTADGRVVVNLQEGDGKSADAIQRCRAVYRTGVQPLHSSCLLGASKFRLALSGASTRHPLIVALFIVLIAALIIVALIIVALIIVALFIVALIIVALFIVALISM
eukprot:jgi/Ulvmu1/2506/UM138_0010.1